ncbi:MAG: exonuclease SbcCD subunit D [Rubricoccaceae bacterium]
MKLLHCADIHIGYETHGRLDPETGLNTRLLDFRRCFDAVVARALDERVDAFLFAGDAYRTADPTPTQQKLFAEALRPVADAGIPIVMVVGNHDHPVAFGKASSVDIFGLLRQGVHVFATPATARIDTRSGPLQLIALPWPIRSRILSREEHRRKTPHEIRDLIEAKYTAFVQQAAAELDPSLPAVLVGHLTVQNAELSGSERASVIAHEPTFSVGALAQPGIDYVALGHIHRFQDRNRDAYERGDGPPVVYASSIDRISFKEHDAEKGFVLVDLDPARPAGARARYTFVPTPARRFVPIEVDARGAPDPTAAIAAAIGQHAIADAVVRVRYRVDEAQAPLVDAAAIRDALAPADTVAAIERSVDAAERQRRTSVRRDMALREAMERYVAQHDALAPLRDDLVAAALALEAELDGSPPAG